MTLLLCQYHYNKRWRYGCCSLRPCAADTRQRPDRGPRNDHPSEILEEGTGGAAANRAAWGEIVSLGGQTRRRFPRRSHHALDAPRSELDAYLVDRIILTAGLFSVVQAVRVEQKTNSESEPICSACDPLSARCGPQKCRHAAHSSSWYS
jgi:hypothetical protein